VTDRLALPRSVGGAPERGAIRTDRNASAPSVAGGHALRFASPQRCAGLRRARAGPPRTGRARIEEAFMSGIIYLVGLVVVIYVVLRFFGLV
jgi:hypothetical protein